MASVNPWDKEFPPSSLGLSSSNRASKMLEEEESVPVNGQDYLEGRGVEPDFPLSISVKSYYRGELSLQSPYLT